MKGNFDAYVLWPLGKIVQSWIVDRSTARDFTVYKNVLMCTLKHLKNVENYFLKKKKLINT